MQTFLTKVKSGLKLLPQPDESTCQAACVAMATDRPDTVAQVRKELLAHGVAGDPAVMGRILRRECGSRYEFDDNATLGEAREWLRQGAFLITHGWFTGSGHVIAMRGVEIDPKTFSYRFLVNDPWSEFDFRAWAYNKSIVGYQGTYSSHGMYAACVAGTSKSHAAQIYRRGELDSKRPGMWLHVIKHM